jgi:lipopolysaccharide/colanic/teichoic acid biosynthesis glycosyltransferase
MDILPQKTAEPTPEIFWVNAELMSQHSNYQEIMKYVTQLNEGLRRKHRLYWFSKRIFDILLSSVLITITSPILAIIAVAVKIDSKGPALFLQTRIGHRFKVFTIFKIRTMYDNIEYSSISVVVGKNSVLYRPGLADDPRLTRVGRFLRKFSLDELPQLFNVLMGDLSFVGPRPLTVLESTNIPDWALPRYSVPLGITGLGQITNRNLILSTNRFEPDLTYVRTCSWWLDIKILWKTLFVFISN